jgi:hypothetical protein
MDPRDLFTPKDFAVRLPARFDSVRLGVDLAAMDDGWWHVHGGPYHDGKWESISLHAPGGSKEAQHSFGAPFAPTEAMARCAYVPQVLAAIPGTKNRVRFLRLRAGGEIYPHSDPLHQIDPDLVRLHVPVTTHPEVDFRVAGLPVSMLPGEAWYIDVRFRHSVRNAAATARVHLVIDVVANEELRHLLSRSESMGRGYLTAYFLKHALPRRFVRLLGIGN